MLSREEVAEMADFVARAIHGSAAEDAETWEDLTDDEREQFMQIAYSAMGAHDAWLNAHGFAIMSVRVNAAARNRLVMPPKPTLIRPN